MATSTIKINADRLNSTIHETAEFGAALRYGPGATETGMARLALDDNDALVRQWFASATTAVGCKVHVDQMGNMFAIRPGKKEGPPTAMGSHLDTQPTGGRYDGILGVLSGLEALRTMHDHGIETEYPVCVVNWTNEEGARFPKSIISSAVWAGDTPIEKAWALADVKDSSKTMKSELLRIGFMGDTKCGFQYMPLAAHFELHIEQGPILEAEKKQVGMVMGAQAYRWYTVEVFGLDCHTGSTPFSARQDAMLCAAQIIVASNRLAKKFGGLASTGILTLTPGSTNVVPNYVKFSLDVRVSSTQKLLDLCAAIEVEGNRIAAEECEKGCKVNWTMDTHSPAIVFHPDAVKCVKEAAVQTVGEENAIEIYSGAGHDSCATARICPTAMVFVPSKDGISHNPVEYTSPEECATGAQVLLQSVLKFDASRTA